jgi:hypothetical protein
MHVGIAAQQETARSYLSFALSLFDQTVSAATLDVPLDTSPADGSVMPESSKVLVCTFSGSVTPANGSLASPPAAECTTSAPATYVATPSPHLHADLGPLATKLSQGAGLVLIPDAAKSAQTDVWQVVFSAHDRTDSAKTPPATLGLTLTDVAETPETPIELPSAPPAAAPPPLTGVTTPLPPAVQQPTVSNPAPTVPAVPQARTVTVGYAYPTVWLLPLGFLILVPLVARTLTRDLTPDR